MVVLHIERGATLMRLLRQLSFRSQGQLAHHIEISERVQAAAYGQGCHLPPACTWQ